MFIWPDSMPLGGEWLMLALVPLGLINPARFPLFAMFQVSIMVIGVVGAIWIAWRRMAWRNRLWLILPLVYLLMVLCTNLILFFWFAEM